MWKSPSLSLWSWQSWPVWRRPMKPRSDDSVAAAPVAGDILVVRNSRDRSKSMENVLALLALGSAGWFVFQAGKRLGSRKGYGVGRHRRVRENRRRRALPC